MIKPSIISSPFKFEPGKFDKKRFLTLKKLVSEGEGQRLELKTKAAHPEKIVREMLAFANSDGGILLLGVGDDGSIPGLKFPEEDYYAVMQALRNCKPLLCLKEEFIFLANGRVVIQFDVMRGRRIPHVWVVNGVKEIYVRADDKSIRASREMREIVRRKERAKNIRFSYGAEEKLLMEYLDQYPFITLKKFVLLSKLKKAYASKKLVILVLANVLAVKPGEGEDQYFLGPSFEKERVSNF